jgi:hypothetical protein
MGIENKTNYRKSFKQIDDSSFILDDFDDEVEIHVNPVTKLCISTSSIEVHSPDHASDETFAL